MNCYIKKGDKIYMSKFPTKERIEMLRKEYPVGTKVKLIFMDDIQSPPRDSIGTIQGVDDAGQLLMSWSNGSSLSLIPEIDKFEILGKEDAA